MINIKENLTEAEKEQLYNWSSQLMQLVDNMEQVEQAIQDQLLKSFDDLTEKDAWGATYEDIVQCLSAHKIIAAKRK